MQQDISNETKTTYCIMKHPYLFSLPFIISLLYQTIQIFNLPNLSELNIPLDSSFIIYYNVVSPTLSWHASLSLSLMPREALRQKLSIICPLRIFHVLWRHVRHLHRHIFHSSFKYLGSKDYVCIIYNHYHIEGLCNFKTITSIKTSFHIDG